MKISYKETDDKLSCDIFVDDEPAGSVFINVYNQKWFLKPNFKVPGKFIDTKKAYDSWYLAGKELARLFRSWGESYANTKPLDEIDFGVDLDEMLSFLKTRRQNEKTDVTGCISNSHAVLLYR